MVQKTKRVILLDADVISHFIKGGEIYLLKDIFPLELRILDKVYKELEAHVGKRQQIDNLIGHKVLQIYVFPDENQDLKKEYFYIKNKLFKGDGESASLAVARYTKNVLASSNLRDVGNYCNMHQIDLLTTMDFLCEALRTNKMDLNRCNLFIQNVLLKGSRLPVKRMEDYLCRNIDFL